MRPRSTRRGAALVWGILVTFAVAIGVASIASTLTDRSRLVRRSEARMRKDELFRAAECWARRRLANDPAWSGTLRETLDGGRVSIRRDRDDGALLLEVSVPILGGSEQRRVPVAEPGRPAQRRETGGGSPRRLLRTRSSLGADRPPRGLRPAWRSEGSSAAFPSAPRAQ